MGRPVSLMLLLTVIFAAVFLAAPVYADGFNTVVEDVRIRLRLDYPTEVKAGSCFSITSDVVALGALSDLTVTLKVVRHGDSGSTVLLDTKLIDYASVSAGFEQLKTLTLCTSSDSSDSFIEANMTATYTVGSESYKTKSVFFMAIIRSKTYSELSAELSSANAQIALLRDEVDRLEDEVRRLNDEISSLRTRLESAESETDELRRAHQALLEEHAELTARYNDLLSDFEALKESFDSLNDKYISLLIDYGSLRGTYESLKQSFEALQSSHESLRKDYEDTSRNLSSLQSLYNDLLSRHEGLKKSYDDSIKSIGSLEGALKEREREASLLRANLEGALSESSLVKSLAAAQAAGIAVLGALTYVRKRGRGGSEARRSEDGGSGRPDEGAGTGVGRENHGNNPGEDEQGGGRVQRVLSGRRVTIPSDMAEKLGLKVGDNVAVSLLRDCLAIRRLEPAEEENRPLPGPS